MRRSAKVITCIVLAAFCASCLTQKLWDVADPKEYVAVASDRVTEEELQAKGITYYRSKTHDIYFVKKSSVRRLGDYTIRTLGTPITLTMDVTGGIVVIGAALFALAHYDEQHYKYHRLTSPKASKAEVENRKLMDALENIRESEKKRRERAGKGQ